MTPKTSLLFLLSLLTIPFISNAQGQAPLVEDLGYRGGSINGIKNTPNALHFIVFGDWGVMARIIRKK
jgi:tartrate-resistant acid phosphatase type 5